MDTQTPNEQLKEELYEARVAKRLRNDFLGDFFQDKTDLLFSAFKNTPIGDVETLVSIHHQIKSLEALKSEIDSVITTGKLAQADINMMLDKAKT